MKRLLACTAIALALASVSVRAEAAELPLRRVVMTTSGLALYEHKGTVNGTETIDLPVRLDSVDDVLKSLVVFDSGGRLSDVSLPGREPLSQAFRDLPFSQQDLSSPARLLNALQGANVRIAYGKGAVAGRLMSVTAETETTDKGVITRHRVGVLTPEGIRTVLLESLDSVQFTDKAVQAQLDRALAATFSNRVKDQRAVAVTLSGTGERTASLAYIQAAPLWKSSYRLILPEKDTGKAFLQGWAILENTTGQDWDGVGVTLASGSPVTYRQALYQSYYVPRPDLPLRVMNRILPRTDEGAVQAAEAAARDEDAPAGGARFGAMRKAAPAAMNETMAAGMEAAPSMDAAYAAPEAPPAPFMPPLAQTLASDASETASQMIFSFPQPVTLASGHTMMLPFVSRDLPAEAVYVYQPETDPRHPLAAVAIDNDSGTGLPPGILTLFERSPGGVVHVGDAEMPLVPDHEKRFISFALDSRTLIDMQQGEDRRLGLIAIAGGALNQKVVTLATSVYTIKAPADESRTVVLELPRREGWTLEKPEDAVGAPEMTATHYRVKIEVAAGGTKTVRLVLRRDDLETVALDGLAPGDLDSRIAAAGPDLPPALRKALEKVKSYLAEVYAAQTKLNQLQEERNRITQDQARLRENLRTVSPASDLGKRYLRQMNAQEDRMEAIDAAVAESEAALRKARQAMNDYIASVKL